MMIAMWARRALVAVVVLSTGVGIQSVSPAPSRAATAHGIERDTRLVPIKPHTGVQLEKPAHGPRAVRLLGSDLGEAATLNGLTPAHLRSLLLGDPSTWVDTGGRLMIRDPKTTSSRAVRTNRSEAIAPLTETFALHSLPGSQHTIYLDFDGVHLSEVGPVPPGGDARFRTGSIWTSIGVTAGDYSGWDPAGDGAGFSDSEKTKIQDIWASVAEDYAPFDVDVTTEDPGEAALVKADDSDPDFGTRVAITDDDDAFKRVCDHSCGGLAYINTNRDFGLGIYQPAWVFGRGLGPDNPRQIAETAAHEAGHNLGLFHDGLYRDDLVNGHGEYDSGHQPWAPIMGQSDAHPVSQWSKGDYQGADNQQDDLAVIEAHGLPRRSDEAGGTTADAAAVNGDPGYITTREDHDVYALGQCVAPVVTAEVAAVGPDLDVDLSVVDSTGQVIASDDPPAVQVDTDHATGLDASIALAGSGGPYFAVVDGGGGEAGGAGDPITDFDDYGSLGRYSLTVTGCTLPHTRASEPSQVRVAATPTAATVTWQPPINDGGSPVADYEIQVEGDGAWIQLPSDSRSFHFADLDNSVDAFSIRAITGEGPGVVARAKRPRVPGTIRSFTASYDDAAHRIAFQWQPATDGDPVTKRYHVVVSGFRFGTDFPFADAQPATTSFAVGTNDFSRGHTYSISIYADNEIGDGPRTTVELDVPAVVPGQVVGLTGSADPQTHEVSLSWGAPSDDGGAPVTGYQVSPDEGATWIDVAARSTTYVAATTGDQQVQVRAVNSVGSGPVESVVVTVPSTPGAVDSLTIEFDPLTELAEVRWNPPQVAVDHPVTGYEVQIGDDVVWTGPGTSVVVPTVQYFRAQLTFTVTAVNDVGHGVSTIVTVEVPPQPAPGQVTDLAAVYDAETHLLHVSWSAPPTDPNGAADHYGVSLDGGYVETRDLSIDVGPVSIDHHTIQLFAINNGGSSSILAPVIVDVPATPTAPTATPGNGSAQVSWEAPDPNAAPITTYTLTASPGGLTKTVTAAVLTTTISGLTNGTPYTFTVHATNDIGDSATSPTSNQITPAGAPTTPTAPTAVRGDHTATLTWEAPDPNGTPITTYTLTASPGGLTKTVTAAVLTTTINGLTNGTPYTFTLLATNDIGDSATSPASNQITPAGAPTTPTAPTAARGDHTATLTWEAPDPNGTPITTYTLTASPGGLTKTVTAAVLTTTINGLTNGTPYTFTLLATNDIGDSATSPTSNQITPAGAPTRVSKPTAKITRATVVIAWKPPGPNGSAITGYLVDISKGKDQTRPGSAGKATFKRLKPGRYTFTVTAINAIGRSTPSAKLTVRIR